MARFRAYTSDSSDEDAQDEKSTELQPSHHEETDLDNATDNESVASSSSELHEEDLAPSRTKSQGSRRNALRQDENGDYHHYEADSDDEESSDKAGVRVSASSSASSPPPRPRGDPTIIPWAQHVGVDPQKMHVMQTSLFRVPEEAALLKSLNRPSPHRQLLALPHPLSRKHSRDSDGDGLRTDSRERASFAQNIEPLTYRPSRKYARVGSAASVVAGNEGALLDAGLSLGRSFRVGWGPGGTLVHLGSFCGPSSNPSISANSSVVYKTTVPVFSTTASHSEALALSSKLLQHHLSNSPIEPDDDGIPFANPSPTALEFSTFASLFPTTDRSYEASLFRLGHALFDPIQLTLGRSVPLSIQHRVINIRRKAALSAWLENAVASAVETDLRNNPQTNAAGVAFMLLTGNQVEKACQAAVSGGLVKLATLISQAGGDAEFRDDLDQQLEIWREQRIDVHIDDNIRKVYALLAGKVDGPVEGSKGGGQERCADVDVLKGLDWKRTFGMHLWFSEPVDAPISQVFQAYNGQLKDTSLTAKQRNVAQPTLWDTKRDNVPDSRWKLPDVPPTTDSSFSLIRLHADPACSLSHVLSPLSYGASPLDLGLAWHLYIILSRCMRIRDFSDRGDPGNRRKRVGGLRDLSPDDDEESEEENLVDGHSPSADLLASSYAFQLESLGMIQEAIFVLLHIEGSAGREKAIKDLLGRSASDLDEWMTRGLVGSLKLPMSWVNEAKAVYALSNGRVYQAYELYLAAGLYNPAHDIAVLELAPEGVLRRDLDLLQSIFKKFVGHAVDDWHIRGKTFLDYAHIMKRVPQLHEMVEDADAIPDAAEAQELEDLTKSIPKLIGILPDVLRNRSDARHNAALAEMMSKLVSLMDRIKPLALLQVQMPYLDETTKLQHIHSTAYSRFLKSIAV